ncbi:MAG: tRNA (adenosine(37)-N6)-threonylcarbamoyltransferase complex transferase subunit TsaD [Mesoaciditoga sp.]|uniref:tRNA (adenosine(37)-N6)-threonylcarbamoyltransferase complex transferase subunit TsaD n=1 Tax=Athalassotoga sp. TaxID=2022597 RepID=UPI000CB1758C|nr:MAG: tRNA (adenosine(37)-N6)-threonylcarbamoyltransferase complex transferase subunit TsaD [Mesoaciditoga sp.]HEU24606.1 tRNA (adenosine(37)-N6)-threonylcarbamoyltransferase complex transferase subunit TsaD [Mesoaciditoga lauensis]
MAFILGIESSCDETSVAIVENGEKIISEKTASQINIHALYGGVVPEIASRYHLEKISILTKMVFDESKIDPKKISAVAVTYGPGLVGPLLVGLSYAKGLSYALKVPLIGVNHMIGHLNAVFLFDRNIDFPCMVLMISGAHTEIVYMRSLNDFEIIGKSIDDAAGEAFDKVARMLGLPYPGGPQIDRASKGGRPSYNFTRPKTEGKYDFSFSGLKTHVLYFLRDNKDFKLEDVASSFQETVASILVDKVVEAALEYKVKDVIVAGGVAANSAVRRKTEEASLKNNLSFHFPPLKYCTDNASMIAAAGWHEYKEGRFASLDLEAVPNLEV